MGCTQIRHCSGVLKRKKCRPNNEAALRLCLANPKYICSILRSHQSHENIKHSQCIMSKTHSAHSWLHLPAFLVVRSSPVMGFWSTECEQRVSASLPGLVHGHPSGWLEGRHPWMPCGEEGRVSISLSELPNGRGTLDSFAYPSSTIVGTGKKTSTTCETS